MWLRTCWTICSWLEQIRNLLICRRIQQKIHETHKINFVRNLSAWGVRIRNLLICYRILEKIHEAHKHWHPSEQNYTYLFRDSNNLRGCATILEIPEGTGVKYWGPILADFLPVLLWGWYGYFLEPHIYTKEEVVKKSLKHMLWQAYNVRASYTAVKEKDYNPFLKTQHSLQNCTFNEMLGPSSQFWNNCWIVMIIRTT